VETATVVSVESLPEIPAEYVDFCDSSENWSSRITGLCEFRVPAPAKTAEIDLFQ